MSAGPAGSIDVARLLARDKRALGRAVSLCEDARAESAAGRAELIDALAAHPGRRRARLVGVTGPPASGKSSLLAEVAARVVDHGGDVSVAVLAVDPSSPSSGGSLLGDRVRARFPPGDVRLFFRSQASEQELGGLGRFTFSVCRLLQHVFDFVFVETVGVGQSEVDVHRLVDRTYLVLPPAWGDGVQLMKAGILEVPDAVVLSKQDLEEPVAGPGSAAASPLGLRKGGGSARLAAALARDPRALPLYRVSAHTGSGIKSLVDDIINMRAPGGGDRRRDAALDGREGYFFERWVRGEFGRRGMEVLTTRGFEPERFVRESGGYDRALSSFSSSYRCWLCD